MASTKYPYALSAFTGLTEPRPSIGALAQEIRDSAIVTALDYVNMPGEDAYVDIWFADTLSGGDETILNGLVTAHTGVPLPVLRQVLFQGGHFSDSLGDYALVNCPDNGTVYFSFMVPFDFVTLFSLDLIAVTPTGFTNKIIKIYSDYGNVGESPVVHSEANTTKAYTAPANLWGALDISSIYSALSQNDVCGLKVKPVNVGTDFKSIGIRMVYEVD